MSRGSLIRYHFLTRWRLMAPVEAVYRPLSDPTEWPRWWPGLVAVTLLEKGDEEGRGRRYRYTWRSALGYRIRFDVCVTRVQAPHLIEAIAGGDLTGLGRWVLREVGETTEVTYLWRVRTTPRWMQLTAPLARPLFTRSHHVLMRRGALGLAHHLAAPLIGAVEVRVA